MADDEFVDLSAFVKDLKFERITVSDRDASWLETQSLKDCTPVTITGRFLCADEFPCAWCERVAKFPPAGPVATLVINGEDCGPICDECAILIA